MPVRRGAAELVAGNLDLFPENDRPLSLRSCRRPPVAFPPLHALQIDAVQEHGQVGGADFDTGAAARCGELEAAFFETLVVDDEAVRVPEEQLETVAELVAEDEEVAGQGVPLEA